MKKKKIDTLIVNSPYSEPQKYWHSENEHEHELRTGRRKAGYVVVNPQAKQQHLGLFRPLDKVEKIRLLIKVWREAGYSGTTSITKRLLRYWTDIEERGGKDSRRFFFCQLEAMETLIYLTEVNTNIDIASDGGDFVRWCCKMATGTGKTVVMSMLIAWQVLNKVANKRDKRFSRHIFLVAPNLTVKERLKVLFPTDAENFYTEYNVVPSSLRPHLTQAEIVIENWHSLSWENEEQIAKHRSIDKRGALSNRAYVRQVLGRSFEKAKNIIVINDEAHHAWRLPATAKKTKDDKDATIWINGLDRLHDTLGILKCFDFSATPFRPKGKKNNDVDVFSWIVSDFGLNDAIESGLVKTPRVVVRDDGRHTKDYKSRLYHIYMDETVKADLNSKYKAEATKSLPSLIHNAYALLAKDWQKTREAWLKNKAKVPPVMITVANSTDTVKRLEYSFLKRHIDIGELCETDNFLRIDSKVLKKIDEEGESAFNKKSLKEAAQSLRETVNTVGKKGKSGEQIMNVISVDMLSEGWSANNVTHIMGLRAFSSQLLCEQVIGRGLRRTSYEPNENDMFSPEYVNIFGVPFSFLPHEEEDGGTPPPPPVPTHRIEPDLDKRVYEISFPNILRINTIYKSRLSLDLEKVTPLVIDPYNNITQAELSSLVNNRPLLREKLDIDLKEDAEIRLQTIVYKVTSRIFEDEQKTWKGNKAFLLVQLLKIVENFILSDKLTFKGRLFDDNLKVKQILIMLNISQIVEHVIAAVQYQNTESTKLVLDKERPIRSTSDSPIWYTRKKVSYGEKSHINLTVFDSRWESTEAYLLDKNENVKAWVKNDHLGFHIWYIYQGQVRRYIPDFIIHLANDAFLVLEVKGKIDGESRTKFKALEAWVKAVNADGRFGKWLCATSTHPQDIGSIITKFLK